MRDLQTEQTLCWAIAQRRRVTFGYRKDHATHAFEPAVVYRTANGKVHVSGMLVAATATLRTVRVFEVGRIVRLVVTSIPFEPDPAFDRDDPRYGPGVICSLRGAAFRQ